MGESMTRDEFNSMLAERMRAQIADGDGAALLYTVVDMMQLVFIALNVLEVDWQAFVGAAKEDFVATALSMEKAKARFALTK